MPLELCSAEGSSLEQCKVLPGLEILHCSFLSVFSNFSNLSGWLPVGTGLCSWQARAGFSLSRWSWRWNSLLLLCCPKTKPEMVCEGESASQTVGPGSASVLWDGGAVGALPCSLTASALSTLFLAKVHRNWSQKLGYGEPLPVTSSSLISVS